MSRIGRITHRAPDPVGVAMAAAAAGWSFVSAAVSGGDPVPPATVLVGSAVAFLIGRRASALGRAVVPAVVVGGVAGLTVVFEVVVRPPGWSPFVYPNAETALFLQGAVAGLMVALASGGGTARALGLGAAGAFGVLLYTGVSLAAAAVSVLPAAALLARRPTAVRRTAAAFGGLIVLTLLVTTVLGATYSPGRPGPVHRAAAASLTELRLGLWHDAAVLMGDHPVVGVGPGRFQAVSPVARSDPDARWTHNGFLQQGAEQGVPGLVLLLGLFLWGLGRLARIPAGDRVTALGAAALGALGVHATVDYVLHFPVLPVVAAALAGAGTAPPGREAGRATAKALAVTIVRKAAKAAVLPAGVIGRGREGQVVILLYHRVGAGEREIDLPTSAFERQMAWLAEGRRVRSLDQAVAEGGEGGVVVSFDDGYADFYEHALPVLVRYRIPAVLYLATGLVADGRPRGRDALTWGQLEEAVGSGLVTVGSHTHSHTDLLRATEAEAEREMGRSKELIEDRLGAPCRHFAYPWSLGSPDADRVARRLFDTAALTWGSNRRGRMDRYRLGRVPVLRSDGPLFFPAKAGGLLDGEAVVYRALRRGPWRRR